VRLWILTTGVWGGAPVYFSGELVVLDKRKDRGSSARRTGPALEAMYRFIMWLVPTAEKFPRSQKFLLGDRMQSTARDVMERLIEASSARARQKALLDANLGVELSVPVDHCSENRTLACISDPWAKPEKASDFSVKKGRLPSIWSTPGRRWVSPWLRARRLRWAVCCPAGSGLHGLGRVVARDRQVVISRTS
jgi:hypothetical protein